MFKSNEVTITDKFREDRSSQHDSRRPLDRYQEYDNRLKAAEKALNGLLKPNNKELSPRERMIYQQAMEELKILNTDNYAINAHLSEEWALYAARRAHLKALFRPGEARPTLPGKVDQTMEAWKHDGQWAKRALDTVKYKQRVEQAERDHQNLEQECDLDQISIAIEKLGNAIWYYDETRQKNELHYCEDLQFKLKTIQDYLQEKPIGLDRAYPAWDSVKKSQSSQENLRIVDLREVLYGDNDKKRKIRGKIEIIDSITFGMLSHVEWDRRNKIKNLDIANPCKSIIEFKESKQRTEEMELKASENLDALKMALGNKPQVINVRFQQEDKLQQIINENYTSKGL